jgi:hypothetical protein
VSLLRSCHFSQTRAAGAGRRFLAVSVISAFSAFESSSQ